jgi:hypothetical protein
MRGAAEVEHLVDHNPQPGDLILYGREQARELFGPGLVFGRVLRPDLIDRQVNDLERVANLMGDCLCESPDDCGPSERLSLSSSSSLV